MKRHLLATILTVIAAPATANIEWPLLYAFRAVEFTTALVHHCNEDSPPQASTRLRALEAWKLKNESLAKATRDFNIARSRSEGQSVDLSELDRELKELEASALRQVGHTTCSEMAGWLLSEESDLLRQLPHFMRPKPLPTQPPR